MKPVLAVFGRRTVIDDTVGYMAVRCTRTASGQEDLHVSTNTWCAVTGYTDALDMWWGLMRRGLPVGTTELPAADGPFADAARLDGRWRELMASRG